MPEASRSGSKRETQEVDKCERVVQDAKKAPRLAIDDEADRHEEQADRVRGDRIPDDAPGGRGQRDTDDADTDADQCA